MRLKSGFYYIPGRGLTIAYRDGTIEYCKELISDSLPVTEQIMGYYIGRRNTDIHIFETVEGRLVGIRGSCELNRKLNCVNFGTMTRITDVPTIKGAAIKVEINIDDRKWYSGRPVTGLDPTWVREKLVELPKKAEYLGPL